VTVNSSVFTQTKTIVVDTNPYAAWRYSRALTCNTTASGAGVTANVYKFPVLIRLTENNFNFTEAAVDGADLRFAKANGAALPFEIERWDATIKRAEIWVKLDTVYGNDFSHHFRMFWGASTVASVSSGAAVFDTAAGFQGVWHLAGEGVSPAYDATKNRFDGVPYNMTGASGVDGAIGAARKFDGTAAYITMPGTASSKLSFPARGTYTLSAWVCTDTLRGAPYSVLRNGQQIISKGDFQYNLDIDNRDRWHMSEVEIGVGYHRVEAVAQAHVWTLVVAVRDGSSLNIYVNGAVKNDSLFTDGAGTVRDTTGNVVIGKMSGQNNRYFDGMIDEVRIGNAALSPDWIKLCYMNQKTQDNLIVWK